MVSNTTTNNMENKMNIYILMHIGFILWFFVGYKIGKQNKINGTK